jgi:hypothetical protein
LTPEVLTPPTSTGTWDSASYPAPVMLNVMAPSIIPRVSGNNNAVSLGVTELNLIRRVL